MMSSWKREGRNVVLLMTLMMWILFIIKGAEATTTVANSSVAASPSITTQPPSSLIPSSAVTSSSSSAQVTATLTPASVSSNVSSSMQTSSSSSSVQIIPTSSAPGASSSVQSTVSPSATSAPGASSSVQSTVSPSATSAPGASSSVQSTVSPSATSAPGASATVQSTVSPSATPSIPVSSYATTTGMQTSSVASSEPSTAHVPIQSSATSSTSLSISSVSPTGKAVPQGGGEVVYIKMTFKMSWGRLCFLLPLFKQALSDDLIELKPLQHGEFKFLTWQKVKPARIKLMNEKEKCENKTFFNDEAVLKFYISNNTEDLRFNDTGFIDIDKDMTIKAFRILHGYWVNKRMILLDKIFENKVEKVELIGADEEDYVDEYTESQRIGIAIGVGLAVVVLIILIYFCVRGYRDVKSVGRTPEDKRMIFTNTVALNEEATRDAGDARNTDEPRSDEPDEVVVHTQPLAQASDEMPLLSAVKDYEDGKKDETDAGKAPLAKPEPDTVSEGEPIKPPDEPEGEPVKSPDEPEGEPIKSPDGPEGETIKSLDEPETVAAPEEAPPDSEPPATEKPDGSFTSSVTIIITPESSPTTIEFPAAYNPPEPEKESDDVKPDLGQSDNVDVDPTQGAINLAFDNTDETPAEEKDKEDEEETKF